MAEGVLTPAALHLRARKTGRGRGVPDGELEHGPRCHRLHFSQVMESPPRLPRQPGFSHSPNVSSMCPAAGGPVLQAPVSESSGSH